jgi:excisionase family DNA binding protein
MITPHEAAAIAQVSSRTIYRWIEDAKLHFTEELGGVLFVCADSLQVNANWTERHEDRW